MEEGSLRGRLLVASPDLTDPNFAHTVVLLLAHDDREGALGVVVNRPSEVEMAGALRGWGELAAPPSYVFVGGPVEPGSVIGLARTRADGEGVDPVLDGAGVLDLARPPEELDADIVRIRVFAGYSGWGAGQVEMEIAAGGWFVVGATPDDAFSDEPGELWSRVLRRQGGVYRTVAPDPTLN